MASGTRVRPARLASATSWAVAVFLGLAVTHAGIVTCDRTLLSDSGEMTAGLIGSVAGGMAVAAVANVVGHSLIAWIRHRR